MVIITTLEMKKWKDQHIHPGFSDKYFSLKQTRIPTNFGYSVFIFVTRPVTESQALDQSASSSEISPCFTLQQN